MKNVALNRPWKRPSYAGWEMKQEGRVWPCLTSAGKVCSGWVSVFCSVPVFERPQKRREYWFGVTNKFQWVGKFANMESVNNEGWLYFFSVLVDEREMCLYHILKVTQLLSHTALCRGHFFPRDFVPEALWAGLQCGVVLLPSGHLSQLIPDALASSFLAFSLVFRLSASCISSETVLRSKFCFRTQMELSLLNNLWIIIWWSF